MHGQRRVVGYDVADRPRVLVNILGLEGMFSKVVQQCFGVVLLHADDAATGARWRIQRYPTRDRMRTREKMVGANILVAFLLRIQWLGSDILFSTRDAFAVEMDRLQSLYALLRIVRQIVVGLDHIGDQRFTTRLGRLDGIQHRDTGGVFFPAHVRVPIDRSTTGFCAVLGYVAQLDHRWKIFHSNFANHMFVGLPEVATKLHEMFLVGRLTLKYDEPMLVDQVHDFFRHAGLHGLANVQPLDSNSEGSLYG